jgi:hypothetical protein
MITVRRAGLVQAVEPYRLWPEGPRFEPRSPRVAQARVRLATDTLPQTPHSGSSLHWVRPLFMITVSLLLINHEYFVDPMASPILYSSNRPVNHNRILMYRYISSGHLFV